MEQKLGAVAIMSIKLLDIYIYKQSIQKSKYTTHIYGCREGSRSREKRLRLRAKSPGSLSNIPTFFIATSALAGCCISAGRAGSYERGENGPQGL